MRHLVLAAAVIAAAMTSALAQEAFIGRWAAT